MADITFDSASNSGYQTQDGSGNYSWFHPQHDGDYVKISLSLFYPEVVESNPDGASVTFGGVELELLPEEAGANLLGAQLWGGNVPPSEDVVEVLVTLEGLNIDSIAFATVLLGVHQTSPVIMADIATGSTNPAEVVLDVGSDPGYWVVDAIATSDASITVGAGQTQRGNVSGAGGSGGQSTETGNDPTSMSWTGVTSAWVMCAVALRPAATPTTRTGAIAGTIGHVAASLSGTFVKPTRTGAITTTRPPVTASLVGTFVKPTRTGSIAIVFPADVIDEVQQPGIVASLTGTFVKPTRTGAIAITFPNPVSAGIRPSLVGTFTKPTYVGTIAASVGRAVASLAAIFTKPTYSGSIAGLIGRAVASAAATFVKPTYAGAIAATVGRSAAAIVAVFTKPTYAGTIAATVGKVVSALTGTFVVHTYAGTIAAVVGKAVAAAASTFVKPTFAGIIVATIGRAVATATALISVDARIGAIAATVGKAIADAVSTFVKPTFASVISVLIAPMRAFGYAAWYIQAQPQPCECCEGCTYLSVMYRCAQGAIINEGLTRWNWDQSNLRWNRIVNQIYPSYPPTWQDCGPIGNGGCDMSDFNYITFELDPDLGPLLKIHRTNGDFFMIPARVIHAPDLHYSFINQPPLCADLGYTPQPDFYWHGPGWDPFGFFCGPNEGPGDEYNFQMAVWVCDPCDLDLDYHDVPP